MSIFFQMKYLFLLRNQFKEDLSSQTLGMHVKLHMFVVRHMLRHFPYSNIIMLLFNIKFCSIGCKFLLLNTLTCETHVNMNLNIYFIFLKKKWKCRWSFLCHLTYWVYSHISTLFSLVLVLDLRITWFKFVILWFGWSGNHIMELYNRI
jgi:hypothetical protein